MRVALGVAVVLTAACDYGPREQRSAVGPPLHIVATYPEDLAGIDCPSADPTCGVPIDAPLELRFDRFLLPTTAVRQSIVYYTGRSRNAVVQDPRLPELTPTYDPVERVVRFTLPQGATLVPNALYTVEFPVAGAPSTPPRDVPVLSWGFRAFDGAPLDEQGILRISFRTGEHRSAVPAVAPPSCEEVLSILHCEGRGCIEGEVGCAACHMNDGHAPLGLVLADAESMSDTAIGRVAHQTETGSTTGVALEAAERFGSAMPVIDPLRPDNSYLLYKLLIGASAHASRSGDASKCSDYSVRLPTDPVDDACPAPPAEELARLRSWFVIGEPMPPERSTDFLRREDLRSIAEFIRAGARCP
jgi:hypothetical protein